MPALIGRRSAGGLLLVSLVVLIVGCSKPTAAPTTAAVPTTKPVSAGPAEIELSEPKVTFEAPDLVRFEVRYRFTKGAPEKYYMCDISFPGTKNHGTKPMLGNQLKSEGVIKDSLNLFAPPVKTFEIRVSEAEVPMEGYKLISNVVSGTVK